MEKNGVFGLSFKIIFSMMCIFILDAITIKILPPKTFLFVWYSFACWFFYFSIWGDIAEYAYYSAKNVRFPSLTGGNRTLKEFTMIWKVYATLFFIIGTVCFIVGSFSPIAK